MYVSHCIGAHSHFPLFFSTQTFSMLAKESPLGGKGREGKSGNTYSPRRRSSVHSGRPRSASATAPSAHRWGWGKWCPGRWRAAWWSTPGAAAGGCTSALGRGWSGTARAGPQSESLDGERERERERGLGDLTDRGFRKEGNVCGRNRLDRFRWKEPCWNSTTDRFLSHRARWVCARFGGLAEPASAQLSTHPTGEHLSLHRAQ